MLLTGPLKKTFFENCDEYRRKNMIEVRNQAEADREAVQSLIATVTEELRSIYRPIKEKVGSQTEHLSRIVAISNNTVVGFAEYQSNADSLLVRGLAVSPDYRRQGIASSKMQHLLVEAKNVAKTEVLLSTIKETGNINIFSRMGFTVTSEVVSAAFESIHGDHVTLVNMRKKWHK